MVRAKSVNEYIDWVQQAVFEMGDLRDCIEYEAEQLDRFPAFLDPLENSIKALHQSMKDGNYHFGREDLSFMGLLEKHDQEIPFVQLLQRINETHRKGLDVEEE